MKSNEIKSNQAAIPSLYHGWCAARLALRTREGRLRLDQLQQHVRQQNEEIANLRQELERLGEEKEENTSAVRDQQELQNDSSDGDPQRRAAVEAAAAEAEAAATVTAAGDRRRVVAAARAKRRSAIRGAATLLAGAALWFVVAPLLAAGLYETAFVVTAQDWASKGPLGALPCWNRPLRTLALGVFLLHAWVYSCRAGTPRWVAVTMRAIGIGGARDAGGGGHGEAAVPEVAGGGGGEGGGVAQQQPNRQFFWDVRIEVCVLFFWCFVFSRRHSVPLRTICCVR